MILSFGAFALYSSGGGSWSTTASCTIIQEKSVANGWQRAACRMINKREREQEQAAAAVRSDVYKYILKYPTATTATDTWEKAHFVGIPRPFLVSPWRGHISSLTLDLSPATTKKTKSRQNSRRDIQVLFFVQYLNGVGLETLKKKKKMDCTV